MRLKGISDAGYRRLAQVVDQSRSSVGGEQLLDTVDVGVEDLTEYEKTELAPYWAEEELEFPATYRLILTEWNKIPHIMIESPGRVYQSTYDVESGSVTYDMPEYIPQKVQDLVVDAYEENPELMKRLEDIDRDFQERYDAGKNFEERYRR